MIPEFDALGLLPPGVHDCTLADIESRLIWTGRRLHVFDGLRRFIANVLPALNLPASLLIDGSFVRNKPLPDDIDVVIDLSPSVSISDAILTAWHYQKERVRIKDVYNVDAWVRHPAIPNDLGTFFQYAGDKAAAELKISNKHPKGILRIAL